MFFTETHRSCRQGASRFFTIHRREPVTAKRGQSRRQVASFVVARSAGSSTDVEIKFVPHDQKSATRRLDVVGVPIALLVRHGTKRTSIRTGPMPSVPAVAQHDIVWLVTVCGLAAPNGEESDHQTFVSHSIEVIK